MSRKNQINKKRFSMVKDESAFKDHPMFPAQGLELIKKQSERYKLIKKK